MIYFSIIKYIHYFDTELLMGQYGLGRIPIEFYTLGYESRFESGYDENIEGIKDDVPSEIYKILRKKYSIECDFFQRMWFDIPIPFKEGDIVIGKPCN